MKVDDLIKTPDGRIAQVRFVNDNQTLTVVTVSQFRSQRMTVPADGCTLYHRHPTNGSCV